MFRTPLAVRLADAVYGLLWRLLPRRLRRRHGRAMRRMARSIFLEAHRAGGLPRLVRVAVPAIADLLSCLIPLRVGAPSRGSAGGGSDSVLPQARSAAMRYLITDLLVAARSLRKRPMLILVVTVTLSLGIGATTAVFSVVWGAWLKPLPYPEAERLVRIGDLHERFDPGVYSTVSIGNYVEMKEGNRTFESTTAFTYAGTTLGETGRRLTLLRTEPNLFETLGISPIFGRTFSPEDPDGDQSAIILSHGLWQGAFGGSRDVLGREAVLFERPWTVVGVAPEDLEMPREVDAVIPFHWSESQRNAHGGRSIYAVGRLRADVSLEAAQADLQAIYAGIAERYPQSHEGWTVALSPFREFVVGRDHTALHLMAWAVALLLVITCVNVASLLLTRGENRRREMAVRAALGAGRIRVMSSVLAESLVLALLGGGMGVLVAYGGIDLLVAIFGSALRRPSEIGLNATTLCVALGVTLLTAVAAALPSGLDLDLGRLGRALRERGGRGGRSGLRLRRLLVVTEIALAVVLVSGAGLLLNTTWRLGRADLGFDPQGVVTAYLDLPGDRYSDRGDQGRLYRLLTDRLEGDPAVASVGAGDRVPPDGNITANGFRAVGRPETADFVVIRQVTPGYFRAAGIELLQGETFEWPTPDDTLAGELPAVINAELAEHLFPDGRAVGELIERGPDRYRVAGVVEAVHQRGATVGAQPAVYMPWPAVPLSFQSRPVLLLRAARATPEGEDAALASLRGVLQDVDPGIRLEARPLEEGTARLYGAQEFVLSLMGVFAALALVLGAVGIYGIISYSVARQTREVGIRIALGAVPGEVVGRILRHGVALALVGVFLGLGVAAYVGRFLGGLLYEVSPVDTPTYLVVTVVFLGTAALATYLPARRAARIEPSEALRLE